MSHNIRLQCNAVDGALLRILGTIERRGFRVLSCRAEAANEGFQHIDFQVDGPRDIEVLCRQLLRLLDVTHASTEPSR